MHPFYSIFGLTLPVYGSLMVLAGALGILLATRRAKARGLSSEHMLHLTLMAIVGGVVGSHVLHLITLTPFIVQHWAVITSSWENVLSLLSGGGVFYGALIGGLLAGLWYIRFARLPGWRYADALIPAVPLAHAIGRIGCFMGGCCYGIEVPWGVTFTHSIGSPNGIPLLPIQLIESGCNLAIMTVLLLMQKRRPFEGALTAWYLILYAVARFVLEFFRGDLVRGIAAGISTSQYISLALCALGVGILLFKSRRQRTGPEEEEV